MHLVSVARCHQVLLQGERSGPDPRASAGRRQTVAPGAEWRGHYTTATILIERWASIPLTRHARRRCRRRSATRLGATGGVRHAGEDERDMTPRLLLIFAHPDDESIVAPGLSPRSAEAAA